MVDDGAGHREGGLGAVDQGLAIAERDGAPRRVLEAGAGLADAAAGGCEGVAVADRRAVGEGGEAGVWLSGEQRAADEAARGRDAE